MSNKCCVITGASRGIGLATALRFAQAGYHVVGSARGEGDLQALPEKIAAVGGTCDCLSIDVGDSASLNRLVNKAVEACGRVDVLVNNAGVAPLAPLDEISVEDFQQCLRVNVEAVFHSTRAVWPVMRRQGGGVIVNVSSMASLDPFPGFAAYGASKAWVNLFTKAAAAEGKPHNVRVFAVAPGAVETGMLREAFPDFPREQTLDPDDVAGVIAMVCRGEMRHASGQTIFVGK